MQDAATAIVLKYAEQFYQVRQERWESDHMEYRELDKTDANFRDYTVKIPAKESQIIKDVRRLIDNGDRIYREELEALPNVHFDRHLYQPLLIKRGDKLDSEPPGLNEGERKFVRDLRTYCTEKQDGALAGKELFLLRNLTRGKGVGFFQNRGFYPDFILWIKLEKAQRIVFVEPHGMLYADAPDHEDKVRLRHKMRELTETIGQRSGMTNVALDSYIVSETPYQTMATRYGGEWDRERFAGEHILFPERNAEYDYLAWIIET